ncbi:uncharacterized protein A4U43_C08F17400 [Asparagus officinalis]|nr:uncharacterized protein A4U43_C08F17400 [Asparagus officinalis]
MEMQTCTELSTPRIDIDIESEVPQLHFADINKESEGPLPREVPSPDTIDIDTEVEDPCPEEVPPPEADKFIKVEEEINKGKKSAGEVSIQVIKLQSCTG